MNFLSSVHFQFIVHFCIDPRRSLIYRVAQVFISRDCLVLPLRDKIIVDIGIFTLVFGSLTIVIINDGRCTQSILECRWC